LKLRWRSEATKHFVKLFTRLDGGGGMPATDELGWDLAVDVVCVGAGAGGLAAAIVVVDAGATAFVATFARPLDQTSDDVTGQASRLDRTLGVEVADAETNGFLAALTEDLSESVAPSSDGNVPVIIVGDFAPIATKQPGKRDPVPPFRGGRLGDWGAECVASPFGVVYSRVITDATTPTRSRSGSMVEVARIGVLELDPDAPATTLEQWLSAAARDRGIDVYDRSRLQRLVFEAGQVIGAVFDTSTATLAVRARHGVVLACDAERSNSATPLAALVREPTTAEVCLVREPLSRFSRIELHVRASSVQSGVSAPGR
jgi:hypothetical protein